MTTLNLRPKFMTAETIYKPRMAICERCKTERVLPEGKTQLMSTCADCCQEMIVELKEGIIPKRLKSPANRRLEANKEVLA